ncbi:MAG: WG repeat-containing protein [Spirochaetales bacterium]|nr:WG repeat-containing protein [Spirochaetales bacterium]
MNKILNIIFIMSVTLSACAQSSQLETDLLIPIEFQTHVGYINNKNEIVIKPQFDEAGFFYDGLAKIKKDGKWGLLNINGNTNYFSFEILDDFSEGYAIAKTKDGVGFIDKNGKIVINGYQSAKSFVNGIACVQTAKGWTYITTENKLLFSKFYTDCFPFYEGIAVVKIDVPNNSPLYGVIDKTGKYILEPKYVFMNDYFSEGLNYLRLSYDSNIEENGYGDVKGEIKIGLDATDSKPFYKGYSYLGYGPYHDMFWYILKKNGEFLKNEMPEIFNLDYFTDDITVYQIKKDNKIKEGYIDYKGKVVVEAIYDKAAPIEYGIGRLYINGEQVAYCDLSGKLTYVKDVFKGE